MDNIKILGEIYRTHGTSAVAERIASEVAVPGLRASYEAFTHGHPKHVIEVEAHPHEKSALAWLNGRLKHMGLSSLTFKGTNDKTVRDYTELDRRSLFLIKWLRYFFGPGVALIATYFSLPKDTDVGLMLMPALVVGLTSVALEIQFAWPWLANHVWKRVFKLGGEKFAPFTMWLVNFVYLLLLWGAGYCTVHAPEILGGPAIPFALPDFAQAVKESVYWSLLYTLVLGVFQSDVAYEEERGAVNANRWYQLETIGVVVINTARIAKWVLPNADSLTYIAMGIFFLLKTLPQLLKTHLADRLADREVFRLLDPARAPRAGFFERAARLLASSQLVNLPRLRRD